MTSIVGYQPNWGMPGEPERVDQLIRSGFQQIELGLLAFRRVDLAAALAPMVPGAALLTKKFGKRIEDAVAIVREEARKILEFLVAIGNPFRLNEVASAWSKQVARPVSEQAGWFDPAQMNLMYYWEGDAKDAYEKLLPGQQEALKQLGEVANELNDPLTACARNVGEYWSGVALVIGRTVASLIKAGNRTLTPDLLSVPGEVVDTLVNGLADAWATLVDAFHNWVETYAGIEKLVSSSAAFPGGKWPAPSSVVDDPTRWTAR